MLGYFVGRLWGKGLFPCMDGTDGVQQFLMQSILQQVSLSPCLECTENLYIAGVGRQHNNSCVGKLVANSNECVDAIHLWHLQVHQRDVGMERTELLDSLAPGGRFSYHNHVRLNANETGDPFAHKGMVINCENSNSGCVGLHCWFPASRLRLGEFS